MITMNHLRPLVGKQVRLIFSDPLLMRQFDRIEGEGTLISANEDGSVTYAYTRRKRLSTKEIHAVMSKLRDKDGPSVLALPTEILEERLDADPDSVELVHAVISIAVLIGIEYKPVTGPNVVVVEN